MSVQHTINRAQRTISVKLALPAGSPAAPGMYALAWIAQASGNGPSVSAPAIPLTAVTHRGSQPLAFVVDGNGDPIGNLYVNASALTAGGVGNGSNTDASGDYVIHGVSAGTFALNASGGSSPYRFEYYDNQVDYNAAYPVSVAAGATTTGKNFVLPMVPRILSAPATVSAVRGGTATVQISADRLAGGLCGAAPCSMNGSLPDRSSASTASLRSLMLTVMPASAKASTSGIPTWPPPPTTVRSACAVPLWAIGVDLVDGEFKRGLSLVAGNYTGNSLNWSRFRGLVRWF